MKTITTAKVNCKDCHRCVRSCPVNAIGIEKGHARVVDEKCILCGECVVECPQNAKTVENRLELVQQAIKDGRKVVLSIAPSFAGMFPEYTPEQLFAALNALGVSFVEETALGAEVTSHFYSGLVHKGQGMHISSCCPVVVNLIEKYYPELVPYLAGIQSPMVTHGRLLKERLGEDIFVVFAGPCIAKFSEAEQAKYAVDVVITFEHLKEWLKQGDGVINTISFDGLSTNNTRYFPMSGGVLKSFLPNVELVDTLIISVDGIDKCKEVFEALRRGEIAPLFIEALACNGGCLGGPATGNHDCIPVKKARVIDFARKNVSISTVRGESALDFSRKFTGKPVISDMPTELEIRRILEQIGKFTKADEKNCGACGYNSCMEKAIAVFQGLAETEMCVPYMRSKAESFANIIVENSLNAIIAVNEKMVIQELNPAVQRMFKSQREIVQGMNLTEIIDCSDFVAVANFGNKIAGKRVEYPKYGLITEQIIIPVPEHGLVICVISDVTEHEMRDRELQRMKLETVERATEIINKQMQVAQEIAGLLGETTAETKSALLELIWLIKGKEVK